TATDDDDDFHHGGACDGRDDRSMDAAGADVAKLGATSGRRHTSRCARSTNSIWSVAVLIRSHPPRWPAFITSPMACSRAGDTVRLANRSLVNRSAASFRVSSLVRSASVIRRESLRE